MTKTLRRAGVAVAMSIILASCSDEQKMPAARAGWIDQTCVPTTANGSAPPGESRSPTHHGNGRLWTVLPPRGVIGPSLAKRNDEGMIDMKFPWWRGVEGRLQIDGSRLDRAGSSAQARIPDGYGTSGFQASAVLFPSNGCWRIVGSAGAATLRFVVQVRGF